ncbi:hypothetical protein [Gorillibacterium timonense]|uniref:hypothetical protein n=1 Tax=Gorillibacterium timonense TaxID=1689269 RepID=UPI0011DCDB17|nr:hypothetical protein [Gorillibacterium timonense]
MKQKESRRLYPIGLVFLALLLAGGIVWYKFPYTADRYLPPEEKIQAIMYGTFYADREFKGRDIYIKDRERISEFYDKFREVRGVRLLGGRNGIVAPKSMMMILVCVDDGKEKHVSLVISSEGDISLNGGKKAIRLRSRPKDTLFTSLKAFFSDDE